MHDNLTVAAIQDPTFVSRFWGRVSKSSHCWTWTGERDERGYGRAFLPRKVTGARVTRRARAHRVSWAIAYGKFGERGMYVCHRCDNPSCVRPDHLFLGTATDNKHDCMAKGRNHVSHGEGNAKSKLTDELVVQIRAMAGEASGRSIARAIGVHHATVQRVLSGKGWKHVK